MKLKLLQRIATSITLIYLINKYTLHLGLKEKFNGLNLSIRLILELLLGIQFFCKIQDINIQSNFLIVILCFMMAVNILV